MNKPSVSIIIPTYNRAALLTRSLNSVLAQTYQDFELIIVDDGSTDGSGAIAQRAIAGDPRFRVIRQDNGGLSAARNRGLDAAQGQFVAFLDGDDSFDPRFLAQLHAAIERDGTDWAACAVALVALVAVSAWVASAARISPARSAARACSRSSVRPASSARCSRPPRTTPGHTG